MFLIFSFFASLTTTSDALDELQLKRYCCRRMVLTHVDLIEKLLHYNRAFHLHTLFSLSDPSSIRLISSHLQLWNVQRTRQPFDHHLGVLMATSLDSFLCLLNPVLRTPRLDAVGAVRTHRTRTFRSTTGFNCVSLSWKACERG